MKKRLIELFTIDLRALALFRIALAAIILYDLADRSHDLKALYSNEGVLPTTSPLVAFETTWRPSLHFLSGSPVFQIALFVLAALAAIGLLIGYKTRWACILSWIFLSSLQNRNWYVLQAGDIWLRLLLFWAMFLPLGERFSIDGLWKKKTDAAMAVVSFGSAGLLLQIATVYVFSGLFKWQDPSWHDGTAVAHALAMRGYVTPFGTWLAGFPRVISFLTSFTLWFEILGPFFLFTPFRTIIAALFLLFQAGLGLSLHLALFPWIGAIATIPFCSPRRQFRLPGLIRFERSPAQIFALLAVIFMLSWNIFSLKREDPPRNAFWAVGQLSGLAQGWPMFSSFTDEDIWYVFPAHLQDGRVIDALSESPLLLWQAPQSLSGVYPSTRWYKYVNYLESRPELRPELARYLCHRWRLRHPKGSLIKDVMLVRLSQGPSSPAALQAPLGTFLCDLSN